jgi:hypothetical protein
MVINLGSHRKCSEQESSLGRLLLAVAAFLLAWGAPGWLPRRLGGVCGTVAQVRDCARRGRTHQLLPTRRFSFRCSLVTSIFPFGLGSSIPGSDRGLDLRSSCNRTRAEPLRWPTSSSSRPARPHFLERRLLTPNHGRRLRRRGAGSLLATVPVSSAPLAPEGPSHQHSPLTLRQAACLGRHRRRRRF